MQQSTSPEMLELTPCPVNGAGSVIEIGAHSLKIHQFCSSHFQTEKHLYELGHEVYSTGRISERTISWILEVLGRNGHVPALALGTSAVRDAENHELVTGRLEHELGIRVHILTCWEEASLLARGFLARWRKLPALVTDIGGGSVEIVFLTRNRMIVWDSLPLGVIRLHWTRGRHRVEWIDRNLRKSSIVMADEIHGTGGTVKAIARVLGKVTFDHGDVSALESRVRREGPPARLPPERAQVFLPGVLLVRKLLEFVRADRMSYTEVSVGRRALEERLGMIESGASPV